MPAERPDSGSDARVALFAARSPADVVAWRKGRPVDAATFLRDVTHAAEHLVAAPYLINLCGERYRFAVTFCAALLRGQTCLLPPNHAPELIDRLRDRYPSVYGVVDGEVAGIRVPSIDFPGPGPAPSGDDAFALPTVAADHVAALVFTSGSTGLPSAHAKRWGPLVENVRSEAARLGLEPGAAVTLIGTVPAQHMYGFESTVLLGLHNRIAFHGGRPFFPADIADAAAEIAGEAVLVTTPFHLRTLLDSDVAMPRLRLVVCATAPLAPELALAAEARLGPLLEIYGCTEAGQLASRRPTRDERWETFRGVRIERRDDGWYASGGHVEQATRLADVLALETAERFRLLGRDNDMVNVAGKRTSISYLNRLLTSIPGVVDGAFLNPDEGPGEVDRLIAFAVSRTLDARAIRAALRRMTDPVFLPRPLHLVDALPRVESGKLPRERLVALARAFRDGGPPAAPTRSDR